ncbi:calcium-binding protein [Geitlerinema sp. PCC 9228]|uniref:calcium-binding protein n=1 Tax=Geitlerinema sp. PCC 9228 TaxID=111611 RepID=UPI0008F998E4|nr:calcium-binding protein [Geitlerinema sp. PCC 9228]
MNTLTVSNTNDSGTGSLREAIASASAGDTILFDSSLSNATISPDSQLEIDKDLTINGENAPGLTLDGQENTRLFHLQSNNHLTLNHLTLSNGYTDEKGGAILTEQQSTLTVKNSEFHNHTAGSGGAIFSGYRSTATITNSLFDGNDSTSGDAERSGGAIASASDGEITVLGSEFTNNSGINGGAINVVHTNLVVENSTFQNNQSTANGSNAETRGYGGAIYTDGASPNDGGTTAGNIIIRNSHFENNTGEGQGGGAFLFVYDDDEMLVENSTFTGNEIAESPRGDALGGGLRAGNGKLTIRQTTFAENISGSQGGGLWIGETTPTTIVNSTFSANQAKSSDGSSGLGGAMMVNTSEKVEIINSTLAYNQAGFQGGAFWGNYDNTTTTNSIYYNNTGDNPWDVKEQTGGNLQDGGGNIQFPAKNPDDSSDFNVTQNITIADPKLGPLQDNGGSVPTHALLEGSPAIDAGTSVASVTEDQRGAERTDGNIDVGAFEFGVTVGSDSDHDSNDNSGSGSGDNTSGGSGSSSGDGSGNGSGDGTGDTTTGDSGTDTDGTASDGSGSDTSTSGDGSDGDTNGDTSSDAGDGSGSDTGSDAGSDSGGESGSGSDGSTDGDSTESSGSDAGDRSGGDSTAGAGSNVGGDGTGNEETKVDTNDPSPSDSGNEEGELEVDIEPTAQFTVGDDIGLLPGNDDLAQALLGDDAIAAMRGNDTLYGNGGNDTLFGNGGDDVLYGNEHGDWLFGGRDRDWLYGEGGSDVLIGNFGEDTLAGGEAGDWLFGNQGNDSLAGDTGGDILFGGRDGDILLGGDGDDWLSGDLGDDTLVGGEGSDRFRLFAGSGEDIVTDFADKEDMFLLDGGLTFAQLRISQQGNTTAIEIADTGEILASLIAVEANTIDGSDFATANL